MSKLRDAARHTGCQETVLLDRRSMLESSVGAALAAAVLGAWGVSPSEAGQAAAPAGTAPAASLVRRVVTGHNAEGKSCVVSDETVSDNNVWSATPAAPLGVLRPGDSQKVLPANGGPKPDGRPVGSTRLQFGSFPPTKDPKPTLQNRQGFHRTSWLSYIYMLSGEVTLLLDVEETKLKAGDVIIQRNTSHAWRNDGATPARYVTVVVNV